MPWTALQIPIGRHTLMRGRLGDPALRRASCTHGDRPLVDLRYTSHRPGIAPHAMVRRVHRADQRFPRGLMEAVRREAGAFGRASMNCAMTTLPGLAS